MKNKVRLSYTLLNLWQHGQIDEALTYYFKLGQITSEAMRQGKEIDNYLNNFISQHGAYPINWGGDQLKKPFPQVKWEINYSPHFDLVGVLDVLDGKTIYENKSGKLPSNIYALGFQIPIYFILAEAKGVEIDEAILKHFNQHTNEFDQTIIRNSPRERERGHNFIETIGGEIYNYFEEHNLFGKVAEKMPLDNK
jgi:hypothetical protein